jgi:NodT family efflux transporter outer membrane factor (OMF) lipoprotein
MSNTGVNKNTSLLILVSFLASCSIGPDYQKPSVETPQIWNSHGKPLHYTQIDMKEMAWWKQFHDPQLNQLMNEALANNNTLQSAMGNVLQAKAALQSIKMQWVPSLYGGGAGMSGLLSNSSLSTPNRTFDEIDDPESYHGYNVGFVPNYTLNAFAQIKESEMANFSLEAQEQMVNAVRLAVISQVAASYFSLLGFKQQLEIQQQLLSEMEALRKYTEVQYQQGSVSSINGAEVDQNIDRLKAEIPITENNIVMASNALRALTDKNPGTIVTGKRFSEINPDTIIPANLPSKVLENRPDVAMAEYQLRINNANIGLMKSAFFPTVNITGAASATSFAFQNVFKGNLFWWQVEGGIPILNLSLYANIDKAKGGYYSAYYNYIGTVKRAFEQVDNALSQQASLQKAFKAQNSALNKARYMYKMTESQYNNGAISYANTLFSQLSVNESRLLLNGTKMQQMNNIVNVYQVLGGGYQANKHLTKIKKLGENYDIEQENDAKR